MANWYDYEDASLRRVQSLPFGLAHTFICPQIPVGSRLTIMPKRGDNLAAVTKLGVAGITGYGTRVTDSRLVQEKSGPQLVVTAIEPQAFVPPYGSAAANELKSSRTEHARWDILRGETLHVSTNGVAGVPVPGVTYYTTYSGSTEGGYTGRVCYEQSKDPNTVPGLVLVTSRFMTKGATEIREPNVARVSLRGLTSQDELTREPGTNGKIIQGPAHDAGYYPSRWVVTKGNVMALKQQAIIVVETAYTTLNPATVLSYVNTTNSGTLVKLGLAAGTCRMLAPNATRWWKQGSLWYADYSMLFDADGHNNVESVEETKIAQEVPWFDENGDKKDTPKTVYDWARYSVTKGGVKTETTPKARTPFPGADWSELDGRIAWT